MTLQALLLCDSAIVDAATGKVSVNGIFDKISSPQFPCAIANCMLFFQLRTAPMTKCDIALQIVHANNARENPLQLPTSVSDVNGLVQGIVQFNGFPMHEPGHYEVELSANGTLQGSVKLLGEKLEETTREQRH